MGYKSTTPIRGHSAALVALFVVLVTPWTLATAKAKDDQEPTSAPCIRCTRPTALSVELSLFGPAGNWGTWLEHSIANGRGEIDFGAGFGWYEDGKFDDAHAALQGLAFFDSSGSVHTILGLGYSAGVEGKSITYETCTLGGAVAEGNTGQIADSVWAHLGIGWRRTMPTGLRFGWDAGIKTAIAAELQRENIPREARDGCDPGFSSGDRRRTGVHSGDLMPYITIGRIGYAF